MLGWGEDYAIDGKQLTGYERFEAFRSNTESLAGQYSDEELAKQYSGARLLLQMEGFNLPISEKGIELPETEEELDLLFEVLANEEPGGQAVLEALKAERKDQFFLI